MMIRAALRDLQARRRRYAVAIAGAGLVLALSMVMSGLTASFGNEARRTVDLLGADEYVLAAGAAGPFTTTSALTDDDLAAVRALDGVEEAAPLLVSRQVARPTPEDEPIFTIVLGVERGALGSPVPRSGRGMVTSGEAVIDSRLDVEIGDDIDVGGRPFRVVGTVHSSLFAATPSIYVSIGDVRELSLDDAPLSSAILVRGHTTALPSGLQSISPAEATDDALAPLRSAERTIALVRTLLWIVAVLILGSVLYLSALERTRDMAVFKATGASGASLAVGLAVQAAVVAGASAAVAAIAAVVLAPRFPMPVEISSLTYLLLPAVALAVALVGAIGGMRRAVAVPPALAFGAP